MMTFPTTKVEMVHPHWPVHERVQALTSTRLGGISEPPFDRLNLADHVGDQPQAVSQNRQQFAQAIGAPKDWVWLNQQHTCDVYYASRVLRAEPPVADAVWTDQRGLALAVMTADCLPILLRSRDQNLVAAIHAGWRGLAQGIVENTLAQLPESAANLQAWVGPAISQAHFEVGSDVYQAFSDKNLEYQRFFIPKAEGKYQADLAAMAAYTLQQQGITEVYLSGLCSYAQAERFYSYRRDGQTGRMASVIWLVP